MKTVYMITSGDYEDYVVHRIYESIEDAEGFCAMQNARLSTYDDMCEIEEIDLFGSEDKDQSNVVDVFKAITFTLDYASDDRCRTCHLIVWNMVYSAKPFDLSIKEEQNICGCKGIIPVRKTYFKYTKDNETVKNIISNSITKWKAEKGVFNKR